MYMVYLVVLRYVLLHVSLESIISGKWNKRRFYLDMYVVMIMSMSTKTICAMLISNKPSVKYMQHVM